MPVSQRISDAELRQRLEVVNQGDIILKDFHRTFQDHNYNVPPITDSTRRTLINKLKQLDQDSAHRSRKQVHGFRTKTKARVLKTKAMENICKAYTGLDYSSAEDDEFPAPRASSTMVGTLLGGGDHVPWPQVGGRSTRESGRGRMTAGSGAAASTSSGGGGGGASNGGRRVAGQQENRRGGRGSRSSPRSEKSYYLILRVKLVDDLIVVMQQYLIFFQAKQ